MSTAAFFRTPHSDATSSTGRRGTLSLDGRTIDGRIDAGNKDRTQSELEPQWVAAIESATD